MVVPYVDPLVDFAVGQSSTPGAGLRGLGTNPALQQQVAGIRPFGGYDFGEPEQPELWFNPERMEIAAGNERVKADDYASIVGLSDQFATLQPNQRLRTQSPGEGWRPASRSELDAYAQSIRDPSTATLAARGFERGAAQMRQMFGGALQALGAEELGGGIVERAGADIQRLSPYDRSFAEDSLTEWFVAKVSEFGPQLIESVLTAAAGAMLGGAVGGPFGAAGGAVLALTKRKGLAELAKIGAAKKAQGVALNAAEKNALSTVAKIGGATAASMLSGYTQAVGDIYVEGEQLQAAVDAAKLKQEQGAALTEDERRLLKLDPTGLFGSNRVNAFVGGVPYAALDLLPEVIGVSELLKGTTRAGRFARLRGAAKGAGVAAPIEGTTETVQEGLILGFTGQPLGDANAVARYVESFAAGAAIGGTLGAVGGGLRPEKNLLDEVPYIETPEIEKQTGDIESEMAGLRTQLRLPPEPEAVAPAAPAAPERTVADIEKELSAVRNSIAKVDPTGILEVPAAQAAYDQALLDEQNATTNKDKIAATKLVVEAEKKLQQAQAAVELRQNLDALRAELDAARQLAAAPPAPPTEAAPPESPTLSAAKRAELENKLDALNDEINNLYNTLDFRAGLDFGTTRLRRGLSRRKPPAPAGPAGPAPTGPAPTGPAPAGPAPAGPAPAGPAPTATVLPPAPQPAAPTPAATAPTPTPAATAPTPAATAPTPTPAATATVLPPAPQPATVTATAPTETPATEGKNGQRLRRGKKESPAAPTPEQGQKEAMTIASAAVDQATKYPDNYNTFQEGVDGSRKNLIDTLRENNLTRFEAEALKLFDDAIEKARPDAEAAATKRAADKETAKAQSTSRAARMPDFSGLSRDDIIALATRVSNPNLNFEADSESLYWQERLIAGVRNADDTVGRYTQDNEKEWIQLANPGPEFSYGIPPEQAAEKPTPPAEKPTPPAEKPAERTERVNKIKEAAVAGIKKALATNGEAVLSAAQEIDALTKQKKKPGKVKVAEARRKLNDALRKLETAIKSAKANKNKELAEKLIPDAEKAVTNAKAADKALQDRMAAAQQETPQTKKPKAGEQQAPAKETKETTSKQQEAEAAALQERVQTAYRNNLEAGAVNDVLRTYGGLTEKEKLKLGGPAMRATTAWSEIANAIAAGKPPKAIESLVSAFEKLFAEHKKVISTAPKDLRDAIQTEFDSILQRRTKPTGSTRATRTTPTGTKRTPIGQLINKPSTAAREQAGEVVDNAPETKQQEELSDIAAVAEAFGLDIPNVYKALDDPNHVQKIALTLGVKPRDPKVKAVIDAIRATIPTRQTTGTVVEDADPHVPVNDPAAVEAKARELYEKTSPELPFDVLSNTVKNVFLIEADTIVGAKGKTKASIEAQIDESGNYFRTMDGRAPKPMPLARVRMMISALTAKMVNKPNIRVFTDLEDFRQKDPALYAQAAKAREDFGTIQPAGYSFGNNVIIFSDYIHSQKHLRTVLIHETIGHFGFRSVVPKTKFDALLNSLYAGSPVVRLNVDAAMDADPKLGKLEAIEEFIADNAADLDGSLLLRFWNGVKDFLNKLGFKFEDDSVRYWINLSRKYVKQGTGHAFTAQGLAADLQQMQVDSLEGRYSKLEGDNKATEAFTIAEAYSPAHSAYGVLDGFARSGLRFRLKELIRSALNNVNTMNQLSRESEGLTRVMNLFRDTKQNSNRLINRFQEMMHTAFTFKVTEAEKYKAGEMLAYATLYRRQELKEDDVTDTPLYKTDALGNPELDAAGNLVLDKEKWDALRAKGRVSLQMLKTGLTIQRGDQTTKVSFPDVTEDSNEWKIYTEMRDAIDTMAWEELNGAHQKYLKEMQRSVRKLRAKALGSLFGDETEAVYNDISRLYASLRSGGRPNIRPDQQRTADIKKAESMLLSFAEALTDPKVAQAWQDKTVAGGKFAGAEFDAVRKALELAKGKEVGATTPTRIISLLRDSNIQLTQLNIAARRANQTILTAYAPLVRRGDWQVSIRTYDADTGQPVRVTQDFYNSLTYFRVETKALESKATKEMIAALDEFVEPPEGGVWKLIDADGKERNVIMRVEVSKVQKSPEITESYDLNKFMSLMSILDINLPPEAREKVVVKMTQTDSKIRKILKSEGVPGWDADMVRAVAEHLESKARAISKRIYGVEFEDIMSDNKLWVGDANKLRRLEQELRAAEASGNQARIARAERAFNVYQFQFNKMSARTKGGKGEGRGREHRDMAMELHEFYKKTDDITTSTEDLLAGDFASKIKMWTVLSQLGMSITSAGLNMTSLPIAVVPFLSVRNKQRGFGGGFGMGKSSAAVFGAISQLKNPQFADPTYLEDVLSGKKPMPAGFTKEEITFLRDETDAGLLDAAQMNMLLGTARGAVLSNKLRGFIQTWMAPFSYTEQLSRRAAAIAAYRLSRDRALAEGIPAARADSEARAFAEETVANTLGIYSMDNRPKIARGAWLQYPYMYYQFIITQLELLRNLAPTGKMLMLGAMFFAHGLFGMPGADDLDDLYATLAQLLGLKQTSPKKMLADALGGTDSDVANIVMFGFLDSITGYSLGSRIGMPDIIPLTGIGRAGADIPNELAQAAGAPFGFMSSATATATNLLQYGAEAVGIRPDTTSLQTILRESPVTALRNLVDAYNYFDTGYIANARGQVVLPEASTMDAVMRLIGATKTEITRQYDAIRMIKNEQGYAKEVASAFVSSGAKAKLQRDREALNAIRQSVREWNEYAEPYGLDIQNFMTRVNRAYNEYKRPAIERYLRTTPNTIEAEGEQLATLLGVEL